MNQETQNEMNIGISGTKPGDAPNISRRDELNPKPPTNRELGSLDLNQAIGDYYDYYRQQRR